MSGPSKVALDRLLAPFRFCVAPAEGFVFSRWLFLRLLGLAYLIAFVSLWTQLDGLLGERGINPAGDWLRAVDPQLGWDRWWRAPTLCWLNFSDGFRHLLCVAGVGCSLLVLAGGGTRFALVLLWACYLSLSTVAGLFLGYQWDTLLLEVGFLAILFAPANWRPGIARERPPSRLSLWLIWWLLFRLMFMAGAVKLLSRDDAWWDLSALTLHYETQPLPTRLGWWAHQLPGWVQMFCCGVMFLIELAVPFLIVCGRVGRRVAGLSFIGFMLLIALTGNYCFFNLLTVALSVTLLDDDFLRRLAWWRRGTGGSSGALVTMPATTEPATQTAAGRPPARLSRLRATGLLLVSALILWVSGVQTVARLFSLRQIPNWMAAPLNWVGPFRTINGYGLFAVMTKTRPEIIVEGSSDGQTWLPYEFKWKAGDLQRPPGTVAPHQPRLDWQMWFAALQDVRSNPWFVNFLVRLLQGEAAVLALLEKNPFPDAPPRYVRAQLYEYHFTDPTLRAKTGDWWRRELKGEYCPPISLRVETGAPRN